MNINSVLLTAAMATASASCFTDTSTPEHHVQQFLDALNSSGAARC